MELFTDEQSGLALMEELREQTNNLMGAVQMLSGAIRECEDRKYDRYLAIANQSLYQMLRMIRNVEAAQKEDLVYRPQTLDLAELCRDLEHQVSPLLAEAGVAFQLELERTSFLTTADRALLQRMLLNLISNAARAASRRGGRTGLRLSGTKDRALLTVWDNGAWTEREAEPEPSLRPREGGLGLGLSVARQIAAAHGGTIVCEHGEREARAVASLPVRLAEDGTLFTPRMGYDAAGGFSQVMVELSDLLPYQAFLPADLE